MGRPRNPEKHRPMDKVRETIRASRSTNYTDGYLDGLTHGHRVGYDHGYDDASAGRPHRSRKAAEQ